MDIIMNAANLFGIFLLNLLKIGNMNKAITKADIIPETKFLIIKKITSPNTIRKNAE